jgi:hypothetical protein
MTCLDVSEVFHRAGPGKPPLSAPEPRPDKAGWDPARIARAWIALMKRLGYTRFVAHGGDWGAIVTDVMAAQGHPELAGIHTNMPGAVPPEVSKAIATGGPAPSGLSGEESRAFQRLKHLF